MPRARDSRQLLRSSCLTPIWGLSRTVDGFAPGGGPKLRPAPLASAAMFVFKAAVVGAGTMGGEIAQVIAAAGIPVVLKDVKQEFVDTGLEKARQVTEAQLGEPGEEGEDQPGGRRPPARGDPRAHHGDDRLRRLRRRGLRDRGRARADGDQADGLRRARRGHPGPRDSGVEHLVAVDHGDGRGHAAARQGLRLPLLLSRLDDAADRGDRGGRDLRRDASGRGQLRAGDPQDGGPLRRGARLRGESDPALGDVRGVEGHRGRGPRREGGRKAIQESGTVPMGPVLPHRSVGSRYGVPRG